MSQLFGALGIAGSGLDMYSTWLDVVSNNVANADDVAPTSSPAFQQRYLQAHAVAGGPGGAGDGVSSTVTLGSGQGVLTYDPSNPLADNSGMVRRTSVDLGDQMTQMMIAQRGYEANLAVINRAQTAYQAALSIGH